MSRVGVGDEGDRWFLRALIDGVREQRPISDLVGPTVDEAAIRDQLLAVCRDPIEIEWIAGNALRTDATVTADGAVARVVFARDRDGRLTWLHTYLQPAPFAGVDGGQVIIVNGPSGAGKSTLMAALQSLAPFPLVVLDEPEHIGTVQPAYLIWRDTAPALHRGYLAAIRALAASGNHVAVSPAGHPYHEITEALAGVPMVRVGMWCDMDVLVGREERTGRWAGIAAQSRHVHDGWTYDLEFDTTQGPDPYELAERVLRRITNAHDTSPTLSDGDSPHTPSGRCEAG